MQYPQLTSRQRMLAAIQHRPVDHTPLLLRFWSMGGETDGIPFNWRDEVKRVEATLALGLDDTLLLEPPLGYVENYIAEQVPGVQSYTQIIPLEQAAAQGEKYPLLKKVYQTPDGPLQTVVRLTEDWPRGQDVRLFDDHNIPRTVEPLVKTLADLPRLKHLLAFPTPAQMASFHQRAAGLRSHSQRLGAMLDGGWVALGDAAMWLCGMERILYGQMDEPGFIEGLLDVVHEWEMQRARLLVAEGIDVLVHMAWYETTDFWTPRNYRKLLRPRLQEEIDLAHRNRVKYRYIITKAWKPYRQDFVEMSIDCLTGVDPVQDTLDLAEVKAQIGEQICLMGGVNSAVMLSQWNEAEIRRAVDQAMQYLAPGSGFILYPVDAVFNVQPWENVQILIDQWKTATGQKQAGKSS